MELVSASAVPGGIPEPSEAGSSLTCIEYLVSSLFESHLLVVCMWESDHRLLSGHLVFRGSPFIGVVCSYFEALTQTLLLAFEK